MDFDEAVAATEGTPGQRLRVDDVLAEMESEQAKKARKHLGDPAVSSRRLSRAFGQVGLSVSSGAIDNWRRRNNVTT